MSECGRSDSAKGLPKHAKGRAGRNRFAPCDVIHENKLARSTSHEFQKIRQFPGFEKASAVEQGDKWRRQRFRFAPQAVDHRGNRPDGRRVSGGRDLYPNVWTNRYRFGSFERGARLDFAHDPIPFCVGESRKQDEATRIGRRL